jgi:CRP-like cAMP-binding protein
MSNSTASMPRTGHLKSGFLEGLPPADLKNILAAATEQRFQANTVIVQRGESAEQLFLLTKGRARLFFLTSEGEKTLLVWLTPGKIFGGGAFLSKPNLYLVSTEAETESWALVWDRSTLRGLARRYPRLVENALLLASEYLAWHVVDHLALTCHSARQRLAHLLISLACVIGQKVPGGIELDATNEELASAANISRFTACHLLGAWQRRHIVEKRRGKILLRSLERLEGHRTITHAKRIFYPRDKYDRAAS